VGGEFPQGRRVAVFGDEDGDEGEYLFLGGGEFLLGSSALSLGMVFK
jgi:hypothetical protein